MKTYFIKYESNYGTGAMVVNAYSSEEALKIAIEAGAWEDSAIAEEIDTTTHGLVANAWPTG